MRVTIVVDDNIILVNGKARSVDCSPLIANDLHALQWYDTYGEEEYRTGIDMLSKTWTRRPNALIDDLAPYQSYIDAWVVENAKQELVEAELQRQIQENMERAKADQERIEKELAKIASTQESQTP